MFCKKTGKDEPQYKDRESEDGIYLRCSGCGKITGYEIGFFADLFNAEQADLDAKIQQEIDEAKAKAEWEAEQEAEYEHNRWRDE